MPTSSISNTVKDQAGNAVAGIPVVIDVVPGPSFRLTDGSEIGPVWETKTDPTGLWSAVLEESSNMDPSTSYYRVREMLPKVKGGQKTYFFLVPAADSKLHDCLTQPSIANSILRPVVVLSTGRPTNPYIGMQIFESDTGRVLYWYGSTLGWQPDWTASWGELNGFNYTGGDFTTAITSGYQVIPGFVTTVMNCIAGRQYMTIFSGWVEQLTTLGNLFIAIVDVSNSNVLSERVVNVSAVPVDAPAEIYFREGALSGNTQRGIRMYVGAGTGKLINSAVRPAVISFRDVGPRAAPVITP